jgi:hypothetical protein
VLIQPEGEGGYEVVVTWETSLQTTRKSIDEPIEARRRVIAIVSMPGISRQSNVLAGLLAETFLQQEKSHAGKGC